jgi:hypothetical protein
MKNPQTLAIELNQMFSNKDLESIAKWGCCAFTLLWCLGIEPEDIDAIKTLYDLKKEGAIDEECTVYWGKAIKYLTGRTLESLEKVKIKSIKNIKKRTPVRFVFNGLGHWVGVENGRIAFNSLQQSNCVENGDPSEMRVLKIKGVN